MPAASTGHRRSARFCTHANTPSCTHDLDEAPEPPQRAPQEVAPNQQIHGARPELVTFEVMPPSTTKDITYLLDSTSFCSHRLKGWRGVTKCPRTMPDDRVGSGSVCILRPQGGTSLGLKKAFPFGGPTWHERRLGWTWHVWGEKVVAMTSPTLLPVFKLMTGADSCYWRGVVS